MSTGRLAAYCLMPLLVAGCSRSSVATPDDCHRACEHVAQLELGTLRKSELLVLHEMEERLEGFEDATKEHIARFRAEMAAAEARPLEPPPPGLSSQKQREWTDERKREASELRHQRELGIKQNEDGLVEEKRLYEEAKKAAAAEWQKATSEATSQCADTCVQKKRSLKDVQCLLRTQAVEDIAICG
jgi:hypothetical protein